MNNSSPQSMAKPKPRLNQYGVKGVLVTFILIFVGLIFLLISAGRMDWMNGWFYFGLVLIYQLINTFVMIKINPELLNERGKFVKEGTKLFDKVYFVLYSPVAFLILIVSGLDAIRFGWSNVPFLVIILSVVIMIPAFFLGLWAEAVNSYFETTVRIQDDRKHQVCTSGPYRLIRHPGYASLIVYLLATPLLLGSWWGLVPSGSLIGIVIIRTALEDRFLQQELPGYKEYTKLTRYRLIPGIW